MLIRERCGGHTCPPWTEHLRDLTRWMMAHRPTKHQNGYGERCTGPQRSSWRQCGKFSRAPCRRRFRLEADRRQPPYPLGCRDCSRLTQTSAAPARCTAATSATTTKLGLRLSRIHAPVGSRSSVLERAKRGSCCGLHQRCDGHTCPACTKHLRTRTR